MSTVKNIESIFHDINKYTTVHDQDRMEMTANFDIVRNYILGKMRDKDEVFKHLTRGHCLAGSVADGIKICKPDEFDLLLPIKLSYHDDAEVTADESIPGNVKINISVPLKKCLANPNSLNIYRHLKSLVDENDFLLQANFQSWIQKILAKADINREVFHHNGRRYELSFKESGPAHTCIVKTTPYEFSIDLVPALIFQTNKWRAFRPCPSDFNGYWHAIPKPIRTKSQKHTQGNISWQSSYANVEREIIAKKNNFKNALRILKKLKERQNYGTFKSYFVKTMFLLESHQPNSFWDQPVWNIVIYMSEKWEKYLKSGRLPFFWDGRCNLLAKDNFTTMASQLSAVVSQMKKNQTKEIEKILLLFLTSEEIRGLESASTTPINPKFKDKDEEKIKTRGQRAGASSGDLSKAGTVSEDQWSSMTHGDSRGDSIIMLLWLVKKAQFN